MPGSIVITMAGFGSRFRKAGYTVPKYQIEAHGQCLFDWSMQSLSQFRDAGWQFHFILREEEGTVDWVRQRCAALGIEAPVICGLDAPTDGQATTALLIQDHLHDPSTGFLIYNIDTYVDPSALDPARVRGQGWVPCANLPGDAWSFARTEPAKAPLSTPLRAVELREKRRISDHATIGLYYFASFDLYRQVYDDFYADADNLEAGERYIAPMYNLMIEQGHEVWVEQVAGKDFYALGTPADVDAFVSAQAPS